MLKIFLKTFFISFLALCGVFAIMASLFWPDTNAQPGSGEGWAFFLFITGFGPIFAGVSVVISLVTGLIFSLVSEQLGHSGEANHFNTSRIALYIIIIVLALFAAFLKVNGL